MGSNRFNFKKRKKKSYQIGLFNILIQSVQLPIVEMLEKEPWLKPKEAIMERKTIYTFQSAISTKWKKGRVFLAGDAAHLMPPFMGQGMCAGIRDVSNLAWKIAHCLKNKHSEKLLNTYQSERFSNVKEYIKTTVKMGEFVNAVGTSNITGKVSSSPDGQKSMKSIKPKLGKGLGKIKDKFRGKIFHNL